jgi:hypothetical protein
MDNYLIINIISYILISESLFWPRSRDGGAETKKISKKKIGGGGRKKGGGRTDTEEADGLFSRLLFVMGVVDSLYQSQKSVSCDVLKCQWPST